jgi:phage terminase large subunit-like protein
LKGHSGAVKTAELNPPTERCCTAASARWRGPVSTAHVEPSGNAIVITKQAPDATKIDLLMAAFNAIAWRSANRLSV